MGRLVVVSNRVPLPKSGPAAGGLATAMSSALRMTGGLWFGWSGDTVDEEVPPTKVATHQDITYATVDVAEDDWKGFYEGYANQTLWPLFHYRLDLAIFDRSNFERYRAVNQLFADRLVELLHPDDTIWIHDYHLIPLGEELRRRGCRQRIGFFLHIPFPAPELLVTLYNHKQLIRSLLAYDLVGFQSSDDLRAFQNYVVQELRGGRAGPGGAVHAYGQQVEAGVFPIGIDPEGFRAMAAMKGARTHGQQVQRSLSGLSLIMSVDRLDYSKGLPNRVAAMEMLLENHPELRRKVAFLQIASPSREAVPQYQAIREELEQAVGQINGRFGDAEWTPVRYVSNTYSQAQLCGLYPLAKVGLVTPLRDGMNLVAKEFVATQDPEDPGVLVLSRFAGAARQMDAALVVNPFDTLDVAQAMHDALDMSREERVERWESLMKGIEDYDLSAWTNDFLARLDRAPLRTPADPVRPLRDTVVPTGAYA